MEEPTIGGFVLFVLFAGGLLYVFRRELFCRGVENAKDLADKAKEKINELKDR